MTDRTIVFKSATGSEQKMTERELYRDLERSGPALKMAIRDFKLLFDAYEAGEITSDETGPVVSGILAMYQPPDNRH